MDKDFQTIASEINKLQLKPIYLLHGEEPYFIDKLTQLFEKNVIADYEKDFNQTVLYGKEVNLGDLVESCRRLPMMAERQLVIVKEAQEIRDFEPMLGYLQRPSSSTVLVLAHKYKKADGKRKYYKAIAQTGRVYESKKIKDYALPKWIEQLLLDYGFIATPAIANLLSDYLGNDLLKIENEINKLTINLPKGTKLTQDLIQSNIGISKEYNVFELQKALGNRDHEKAHKIAHHFAQDTQTNSIIFIISMLYNYFSKVLMIHFIEEKDARTVASKLKVYDSFVPDYQRSAQLYNPKQLVKIIQQLKVFDLKAKGVDNAGMTHGELLKELIIKVLY